MPESRDVLTAARDLLQVGKLQEAYDLMNAELEKPPPSPPPPSEDTPKVVAMPVPDWVTERDQVAGLIGELLPLLSALVDAHGSPRALEAHVVRLRSLQAGLTREL